MLIKILKEKFGKFFNSSFNYRYSSSAVNYPPTQSVGSSKQTRVLRIFEVDSIAPKAALDPPKINNPQPSIV